MTSVQGPDRWALIESLFNAACDMPADARSAYLGEACGADGALREELDSLLRASDQSTAFLSDLVEQEAGRIAREARTGRRVGAYRLVERIGEGGMGDVYLATRADAQYEKRVAVKLLRPGFALSSGMLDRFRAERQILANLDHPHIARLLDGGVTEDGLPYLVMEHVDGVPIDVYCHLTGLSLEDRLRLFRQVCDAVEYAHGALVVHRDIKPANILVTAQGVPKLLDFGIAKLLDDSTADGVPRTRTAERLMTPEYASPEQFCGRPATTLTDVYALGALLYELLAGRRAFDVDARSPLDAARTVCEQMPEPPSVAARKIHGRAAADARRIAGDLDRIVLMALRKEPSRRYGSVARLSADVQAYLGGYPLEARTDTWGYRADRFIRRHRGAVAAAATMVLALVAFSVGMGVLARRAGRQERIARREAQFLSSLYEATDLDATHRRTATALDLLDPGVRRIDHELAGEPEVQAALLESMAGTYICLEAYDEALALAERARTLKARAGLPRDTDRLLVLELQAFRLQHGGSYAQAEPLFRELLARRRALAGDADPTVADAMTSLGRLLALEGRDAEAERMLRHALDMYARRGADDGDNARDALALLLENRGSHPEAARLLREALEISRRVKGANSPDTVTIAQSLAVAQMGLGDLGDAERELRQVLEARRSLVGERHPAFAATESALGQATLEEGDTASAMSLLRHALATQIQRLGAHHPATVETRIRLGRALHAGGRDAEAETQIRQALADLQQAEGDQGWLAARATAALGLLAFDRGRYDMAERLDRQALETCRRMGGDRVPVVAASLARVGEDRMHQRDPAGAAALLDQALDLYRRAYAPTHPSVIATEVQLGRALLAEGRPGEAQPILRTALDSARSAPFPLLPGQVAEAESAWRACAAMLGGANKAGAARRRSANAL